MCSGAEKQDACCYHAPSVCLAAHLPHLDAPLFFLNHGAQPAAALALSMSASCASGADFYDLIFFFHSGTSHFDGLQSLHPTVNRL